jgi:hypothetical protein
VDLEPARHARVDLGKAIDRRVVETHDGVVLVGQILDRGTDGLNVSVLKSLMVNGNNGALNPPP